METAAAEQEVADCIKKAACNTTVDCTKMAELRKCGNICTSIDVSGRRK